LQRFLGALMTSISVPYVVKKSEFINHSHDHVTEIYIQAKCEVLREWMVKIEHVILVTTPNVYNALKPADWLMLPASEAHVCKPPKPCSGRPRKSM
jgi:hypothetical protein